MTEPAPVIAIDGPNASGKGAISGELSRRLGWWLLDSGALYRVLAHAAVSCGIPLDDADAVAEMAPKLEIRFAASGFGQPARVFLDGEDVSDDIRTEECGGDASRLAAFPFVRLALLGRQRAFRKPPGLVADGRDMGTVVFPDAGVKIFLTATPRERAERRYKQLIEKGIDVSLATLSAEIAERDRRDRERVSAPTKPAADALIIDTTGMSIEAVTDRVLQEFDGRRLRVE